MAIFSCLFHSSSFPLRCGTPTLVLVSPILVPADYIVIPSCISKLLAIYHTHNQQYLVYFCTRNIRHHILTPICCVERFLSPTPPPNMAAPGRIGNDYSGGLVPVVLLLLLLLLLILLLVAPVAGVLVVAVFTTGPQIFIK